MAGLPISPAVEAKKHIFLHCNASTCNHRCLKFCSMTKSGGQSPRSKFWGGDLSPVSPPVIYAHALNMPLCNEAQSLLDLQVIPIRSLEPNTDSIYGHPIWTRFAMAEVTSAPHGMLFETKTAVWRITRLPYSIRSFRDVIYSVNQTHHGTL